MCTSVYPKIILRFTRLNYLLIYMAKQEATDMQDPTSETQNIRWHGAP